MTTMRVAQIPTPKRPFEIVEWPIPQPTPGTVRIKVSACGVCHSDALVKEGLWPGLQYPRVPGHEVSGTIDAVGEDQQHHHGKHEGDEIAARITEHLKCLLAAQREQAAKKSATFHNQFCRLMSSTNASSIVGSGPSAVATFLLR